MTLDQIGIASNLLGLLIPLVFSLFIARTYAQRYFRAWTLSFLFFTASVVMFILPGVTGNNHWAWETAEIALYVTADWFLLQTAEALGGPTRFSRFYTPAAVLIGVVFGGMAVMGQPFTVTAIGPILLAVAAHYLLGWALWKLGRQHPVHPAAVWLAVMVVVSGTWPLAYPLLPTPWLPAGFIISGALHLCVGIQMVIFLLEDVALVLQRQNEELLTLDRLKSDFISTVSHELRTPISSIKSAAWLLEHHPKVAGQNQVLDIITSQVDVLQRLVIDVLDFAKIESGTLSYQLRRVQLAPLVRAAVHDATPRFVEKGLDLTFEAEDGNVALQADSERLAQVLNNLLSNALKFTEPGGRVKVTTARRDRHVRVTVEDTGVGVPAELRDRIFERFYQVDNTSTRKAGGTGLGLAIARAIVQDGHHGRIWVEENPSGGSRFIVELPLDVQAPAAQGAMAAEASGESQAQA